jgi:hypothetical protein
MDSRDLIQYTFLNCCQTHLNLSNVDSVLKAIEQRPIGFFQAYDSSNLMEIDVLKSFSKSLTNDPDSQTIDTKLTTTDSQTNPTTPNNDKTTEEAFIMEKLRAVFEKSFEAFQSDPDNFSVECSPEIEEMKMNAFGEIIEEILQESLLEFLEDDKQVTDASLKEYYRGIYGLVDKKKNVQELLNAASSEYTNFKKLFKRFIG